MKPNRQWIEDWEIGENTSREVRISEELLQVFSNFWEAQKLDQKSKTTRNRYSAALHSLGGYLTEKAVYEKGNLDKSSADLLAEYVGPQEGPLICVDHESWQNEIDIVCRKLCKYLKSNC